MKRAYAQQITVLGIRRPTALGETHFSRIGQANMNDLLALIACDQADAESRSAYEARHR